MAAKKTVKKVTKKAPKKPKEDTKEEKKGPSLAEVRKKIYSRYDRPVVIYEHESDKTPFYETRFAALNGLLGGGVKAGSIIEIYGPEDSGKSTFSVAVASDIQRRAPKGKKHVVLVNFEGPEPWDWWRTIGLLTDDKHFTQLRPKSLEEGISDMNDLIMTGEVCCVIIDSVYAASSKQSRDKMLESWRDPNKGDGTGQAVEARQWGKAWTAMKNVFQELDVVVLAVNQIREKIVIGGPPSKGYGGPPTTTPRGKALKFYAWVRLEVKGLFLDNKEIDGIVSQFRVIKNKTSRDGRGRVKYKLIRGVGYDLIDDLIDQGLRYGAIEQTSSSWYQIGEHRFNGRKNVSAFISENDDVRAEIEAAVKRGIME